MAERLCETVGEIQKSNGAVEDDGGSFFRVRVKVDVTSPLCRGRVITLPNGSKHWIKFRYECLPSICYWCGWLDHDDRDCDLWIQSNGTLKMDQQQFGSFLRAPPYKSSGRDVIYVPGYYEEKSSKAREKKAEMAAHMAARAAVVATPPGPVVLEKETVEIGGSINSSPVEFNAAIMEDEVYVENELSLGDSFKPRINMESIPPHNSTLTLKPVLLQNPKSANPNKVTLNGVIGKPIITEIKAGTSQFNANSIPSSSIQSTALINEETLAASPQGTVSHRLDD